MFKEMFHDFGISTISIPLGQLAHHNDGFYISIGVAIPSVSSHHLAEIGLFNYATAEKIAKELFESTGKTLTGHWMDCTGPYAANYPTGVPVGLHRLRNHHFLTDAIRTYQDPDLCMVDFYKHLATDVVTKNGLPILPESLVRSLAQVIGTTPAKIMPWISFNIIDIGSSIFAVSHATSNMTAVMTHSAQWSAGHAMNTIGVGTLEVVAGLQTTNPILLGSGAVDIACGAVTAHQYYSQPFFCGVPVADILQSSAIGAGLAGVLSLAELCLTRRGTSTADRIKFLAERVSTSAFLSGLSAISTPLSVATCFGLTGFNLVCDFSKSVNEYVKAIPIEAHLAHQIDRYIAEKYINSETMSRMISHLEPSPEEDMTLRLMSYLQP